MLQVISIIVYKFVGKMDYVKILKESIHNRRRYSSNISKYLLDIYQNILTKNMMRVVFLFMNYLVMM